MAYENEVVEQQNGNNNGALTFGQTVAAAGLGALGAGALYLGGKWVANKAAGMFQNYADNHGIVNKG